MNGLTNGSLFAQIPKQRKTFLVTKGYLAEVRLDDGTLLYTEVLPGLPVEGDTIREIDFAQLIRDRLVGLK